MLAIRKIQEYGFAQLEGLVSLCLSSIITGLILSWVHSTIHRSSLLQFELKEIQLRTRIRNIIQEFSSDIDSYPLEIQPRIHPVGRITFVDQTPNSVELGRAALRPKDDSQGYTGIQLSMASSYYVTEVISATETTALLKGCPKIDTQRLDQRESDYIVLGVAGIWETHGEATISNGCTEFNLRVIPGMILTNSVTLRSSLIQTIVPVKRLYTIYISQNGDLRYLSHRGGINIENQPLTNGAERMLINIQRTILGDLLQLEFRFTLNKEDELIIRKISTIEKDGHLNFTLNRP